MLMNTNEWIVVCGTGIAGLASALAIARAGLPVTLLGPQQLPKADPGDTWHPRVYAISPSSQRFLEQLGIWRLMPAARITPVHGMEVYGDGDGAVHLNAWQAAQPALAWIVESGEIERALQQAVQVYGIDWVDASFDHLGGSAVVTDAGRELPYTLLVGADGAKSPVRHAAGISHRQKPYGDMGVVAHLTSERAHQNLALQWFTGNSVLALLPLGDTSQGHQVSMVWSMPQDDARTLLDTPRDERDAQLAARLRAVTQGRLGDLQVRSPMFAFPLTLEDTGMVGHRIALVGDAAHRVHPLAGQGLNLGLGDVQALAQVLARREAWRSAGDERVLARYRRQRAEPVWAMRAATDGLYRLFALPGAPAAWMRNLGMRFVDRTPLFKRLLISGAE